MAGRVQAARIRDALAAFTVWLPLLVFVASWISWSDRVPTELRFRNDISPESAGALPTWLVVVGTAVLLIGVGIGATSLVPRAPADTESRRVPLFWAGAVAGFVCAIWLFQAAGAINPPADPARANGLAGFAALGAGLYGFIPFFTAGRPERRDATPGQRDHDEAAQHSPQEHS